MATTLGILSVRFQIYWELQSPRPMSSKLLAQCLFDVASISVTAFSISLLYRGLISNFGMARGMQPALSAFKQSLTVAFRKGFLMNRKQTVGYTVLLLLLLLSAHANALYGQGKLGRVRDAVRHEKPAKSRNDDSREKKPNTDKRKPDRQDRDRGQRRSKGRNSKRSNNGNSGLSLFLGSVLTPSVEEVHVIHHSPTPIIAAPVVVAQPEPIYQPVVAPVVHQPGSTFDWGIRLSAVGGTDFDDITSGNFGLLLQIPNGLGIDTSVTMLRESGSDFRDHLYLGDVNVVYEPIYSDFFRMRIGIGVNWLGDAYGGDAGFNMTTGFDWKLTDRLLATGEVDFGSIGDTDLTHAQISLGRAISPNTEWTVGYDYRDIGGVTIGSAFTGLRFRF